MLERAKEWFTEGRWNEICELVSRKGMKISANDFTANEIRFIINETTLSEKEKEGAIMYFVNKEKQIVIAYHLKYSDSTIKYHKKKVSRKLRETCCRIFK